MRKLLVLLVLIRFSTGIAQHPAKYFTDSLCSPYLHGRGYVGQGDSLASAFIASEFKKIGLKPFKKNWFQSFLFTVNRFPGELSLQQGSTRYKPGIDYLVDPSCPTFKDSLRGFKCTPNQLLDINNRNRLLNEMKQTNKNCLLVDFDACPKDSIRSLKRHLSALNQIYSIIELTEQKLTWSVSQFQTPFPYITLHAKAANLENNFLFQSESELIQHQARNVVACVKAKKRTNEWIILTAHYDHLGRMGKDTYFPGANDNASGIAALLTLASYVKSNPLNKNIMFIAFAGEEVGLLGSKYFVEHPLIPLNNISFLLNLDIMGSGEEGITVVNATKHPEYFQQLQDINSKHQYLQTIKSRGPAANSDHYWFSEAGVPAFFIYTMGSNKNYHDVFDTSENLSFSAFENLQLLIRSFLAHF